MKRLLAVVLLAMAASCLLLGCSIIQKDPKAEDAAAQGGAYVRPGKKNIDTDDEEMEAWEPERIMIPQNAWPIPDLGAIGLTDE